MSQAGKYPDCEGCHYKMAYDEEAQSLYKGSGQNTPTNTGSPKLPQLEDVKREAFAEMSATYGMPATNSEIVSMVYGIIERQLRAGA